MSAPTSKKLQTAGTAAGIGGGLMAGLGALGVAAGPIGWAGLGLAAAGSALGLFGGKRAKKEAKEKALNEAQAKTSVNVGKQRIEQSSDSGVYDKQMGETANEQQEANIASLGSQIASKKPETTTTPGTTPPATTAPAATTDPATTAPTETAPAAGGTTPPTTDTAGVTTEQIQKGAQTSSTINAAHIVTGKQIGRAHV